MSATASTPTREPQQVEEKEQELQKTPENENRTAGGDDGGVQQQKKGKTPVVVPLPHETPAAVRNRRHIQAELHIGSPSDNMLSPCTSKIVGRRPVGISGPAAILRNKQQKNSIPFKMDVADDDEDDE